MHVHRTGGQWCRLLFRRHRGGVSAWWHATSHTSQLSSIPRPVYDRLPEGRGHSSCEPTLSVVVTGHCCSSLSASRVRSSTMSVVQQSSVTTVEEPLPTPANSGAKLFFAVAGLGAGWVRRHGTGSTVEQSSSGRACDVRASLTNHFPALLCAPFPRSICTRQAP